MWGTGGIPWSAPRGCASGDPAVWRSSSCISCNHKDLLCLRSGRAWGGGVEGDNRQQQSVTRPTLHSKREGCSDFLWARVQGPPSQCGNNLALLSIPKEAGLLQASALSIYAASNCSPLRLIPCLPCQTLLCFTRGTMIAPPVCSDMSGPSISLQTF